MVRRGGRKYDFTPERIDRHPGFDDDLPVTGAGDLLARYTPAGRRIDR